MSIKDLAQEIAATVEKKGAAYGNAIDFVEKTLTELYPNGVPVDSYSHMLLMVRVLDKLKRLATDPNAFGENPWDDITGYALRGAEKSRNDEREKILNYDFQIGTSYIFDKVRSIYKNGNFENFSEFEEAALKELGAECETEITDEDVYTAVDVLAELLAEQPIVDVDLFDEIWNTLKDLGWSDIDIHDTATINVDQD